MRPAPLRRRLLVSSVVAFSAVAASASALPGVALSRPILDSPSPKSCKLGGSTIRSGSRGRAGGVEYECTDGIACQVEGGRTTRKCSHAARHGAVVRIPRAPLVALAR